MNRMSVIVASWIGTLVLTGCGTVGRESQEGGHREAGGLLRCPDVSTQPIVAHRSATPIFEQVSGIERLFAAGGRTFGARFIDGPDEGVDPDQEVLEELDLDQGLATAVGAPFGRRSIVSVVQHSQGTFAHLSSMTAALQSQILRIDGASADIVIELNSQDFDAAPLAVTTAALIVPDDNADGTQRIEPSGAIEALDRDARLIVGDGDGLLWLIPVFAEEKDCNEMGCAPIATRYELLRTDDRGEDAVVLRDDLCVDQASWPYTGEYSFLRRAGADGRLVVSTVRAVFSMLPDGSDQRFIAGVDAQQLVVDGDTAWIGFTSGDFPNEEFVVWRAPILGGDVEEIYRAKVRPNPDDSGSWRHFSLGTVSGSYVVVVDLADGWDKPERLWRINMAE